MAATSNRTLKTVMVAGGNLFALAAKELGDATQWNRIAALNGILDPMIIGVVTLTIPPVDANAGNGGILGA
jgi:nucleoid-associated protein YgaU